MTDGFDLPREKPFAVVIWDAGGELRWKAEPSRSSFSSVFVHCPWFLSKIRHFGPDKKGTVLCRLFPDNNGHVIVNITKSKLVSSFTAFSPAMIKVYISNEDSLFHLICFTPGFKWNSHIESIIKDTPNHRSLALSLQEISDPFCMIYLSKRQIRPNIDDFCHLYSATVQSSSSELRKLKTFYYS